MGLSYLIESCLARLGTLNIERKEGKNKLQQQTLNSHARLMKGNIEDHKKVMSCLRVGEREKAKLFLLLRHALVLPRRYSSGSSAMVSRISLVAILGSA